MGQSKRQRRKRHAAIRAHAAPAPARIGLSCPVSVMAAAGESGPRRFSMVAYTGEPMNIYGYEYPVVVDCASIDMKGQRIPALLDHMAYHGAIVGQIERFSVENGAPPLVAEGYFTPTDQEHDAAVMVLKKADAGYQWQASIGGDPRSVEKIAAGQTATVNGRTYAGPVCVARGVSLREISFVVLGADRLTSAVLARNGGRHMTFDAWLKAKGYDPLAIAANLKSALKAAWQAELQAEDTPPEEDDVAATESDEDEMDAAEPEEDAPTNAAARQPSLRASRTDIVAEENRRVAANRRRVTRISEITAAAGNPSMTIRQNGQETTVEIGAHAIEQNWTEDRVELEVLRASRGSGPAVLTRSHDRDCTISALEGAMILRAGGRLDHPAYASRQGSGLPGWLRAGINAEQRQRAMDAAHRYADLSAVDLCREALRLEGRDAPHGRNEMIQAAFSSSALTNIFTTNVNAILLSTYAEAPDTTAGWVSEQEVADFKTQERPAMTKGGNLSKLPRGGEADHYSRSDLVESYKISRYAKQFVVDEQDIIDDSLGALGDTPREMGLAAARLRPDLVYGIMLANPTLGATGVALFSASNFSANLLTSAALAAPKLKAAASAMRLFRENSVNLNLMPTHLIVPPTLEFTAYELVNSTENIIAGTAGSVTERGNVNALQRLGLTVVSDARLENGVTHPDSGTAYSGSASTWWLVCNYARTIEVGYLRGTGRAPQTRSWRFNGEGKYGMGWDVKMDIGAKAIDWKGFVQNTA